MFCPVPSFAFLVAAAPLAMTAESLLLTTVVAMGIIGGMLRAGAPKTGGLSAGTNNTDLTIYEGSTAVLTFQADVVESAYKVISPCVTYNPVTGAPTGGNSVVLDSPASTGTNVVTVGPVSASKVTISELPVATVFATFGGNCYSSGSRLVKDLPITVRLLSAAGAVVGSGGTSLRNDWTIGGPNYSENIRTRRLKRLRVYKAGTAAPIVEIDMEPEGQGKTEKAKVFSPTAKPLELPPISIRQAINMFVPSPGFLPEQDPIAPPVPMPDPIDPLPERMPAPAPAEPIRLPEARPVNPRLEPADMPGGQQREDPLAPPTPLGQPKEQTPPAPTLPDISRKLGRLNEEMNLAMEKIRDMSEKLEDAQPPSPPATPIDGITYNLEPLANDTALPVEVDIPMADDFAVAMLFRLDAIASLLNHQIQLGSRIVRGQNTGQPFTLTLRGSTEEP